MAHKSRIAMLALMAGLLTAVPFAGAQQTAGAGTPGVIRPAATTGIRTDRLSRKQLRTWRKIERIVFARDADGPSWHPTLERLWRQVESSGHAIFIEMSSGPAKTMAGQFNVERIDPEGKNHILSIHLHLSGINNADTSERARRADGFLPFERLNREKRYAEVLGHELAHLVRMLKDPRYAALVQEQDRLEAEVTRRSRILGKVVFDGENELRMRRLAFLTRQVEAPVDAVEIEVWRELAGNNGKRRGGRVIDSLAFLQSAR